MSDDTYKTVELTGTSAEDITAAMRNAVAKASESLHNLDWVEVSSIRGRIAGSQIEQFQVTMKVGFRVD
jgi:flavin-binding protein dodecin